MKIYLSPADAVSDLHKKGFTNDFQLIGNDLLWVQEKILIKIGEFAIVEYHKLIDAQEKMEQYIVLGIYAPWHNIRGILVNHYKRENGILPPVIKKKLNELRVLTGR